MTINKERLVVGVVIFLFLGLAVMPSINAFNIDPIADLDCEGELGFVDIELGATITCSFKVINIGDPESLLNWEIESYPELGNWNFCPYNETGQTPEQGPITVEIEFILYELPEDDYHGEIRVVNLDDPEDYDTIPVFINGESVPVFKCIKQLLTSTFSLYCNIGNKIFDPVPDLDCSGDLCWVDVQPGSTVTGTITVENIGDPESLLDWEILSWPKWGTWTFDPNSGTDVLAGDTMTINVEVIWPDPDNSSGGEVVLVNSEDPDDVCIVSIQMAPPPPPPPSFPITLIGKISDLKFNNESISFHTDFVILIFIIIPAISINDDMAIKNDYRGFIGDRFICAYCWT